MSLIERPFPGPDCRVAEALCGDRLAAFFPVIKGGRASSLSSGGFAATRMSYEGIAPSTTAPSPPHEAFAICLSLRQNNTEHSMDGYWSNTCSPQHQSKMFDLQNEITVNFRGSFDFLFFYMQRSALREIADEKGVGSLEVNVAPGIAIADPVIANLGAALLPALESPHETSDLFVGYVAMALQAHFVRKYLGRAPRTRPSRSGLTARQLRIAKHMMQEDLTGSICLHDIARECGLSRSHFARAFAISAGQPPHQWLLEQRVSVARQLLGETELSVGEIALRCGFADQSHFTRVFSARTGLSPGRWRRTRKL
jgi:AraC family transcriptional regulator